MFLCAVCVCVTFLINFLVALVAASAALTKPEVCLTRGIAR